MSSPKNVRLFRPTLLRLEDRVTPSAGALDPTFGVGGKVTTRFPIASGDYGTATAIDGLGRIVVAGSAFNYTSNDFAVARFMPTGALDTSFGGTGAVTISFGPLEDRAYCVAIDSLDRVVVAGLTNVGSGKYDFAIARLTASGALDTSFDGDGKQTIAFANAQESAYGVAIDSQDRVVLAGMTVSSGYLTFAAARLGVSGGLDNSFDGDGKQTVDFNTPSASASATAYAVAIDSQDRVLLAGNWGDDFAVSRLTVAGALDNTFDGDGKQTVDFGGASDVAYAVAVDSQDRVLVAGSTGSGTNSDFAVSRLTATGGLDTSFDGDGKQMIAFGASTNIAWGVAMDSLDRVVVAGETSNGSDLDFGVCRLTAAGALDVNFDVDGKQTIAFGSFDDVARGVACDSTDRVVIAGYTSTGSSDFAATRLTTAGALDSSFDGDGEVTLNLNAQSAIYALSATLDSLGRTVVAGWTANGANADFIVARYTSSGALDQSFGGTGIVVFGFGESYNIAQSVTVDTLDRIVVAGRATIGSTTYFAVARLTTSGALDSSFDGDGRQIIEFGTSNNQAQSVAIDSLGRIVIAGFASNGSNLDFAVARLSDAGALDSSFDGDGKQTVDFGGNDSAYGVAIDSVDRAVVGGVYYDGTRQYFAVARLTALGALDTSFDGDGKETIVFGANDNLKSVAIDSLGRIVVAGTISNPGTQNFGVARLTTSGALDITFDGDGKQIIAFGTTDVANSVAIDSLNRVVVAGLTNPGSNSDMAVARLTATGALDTGFDGDGKQTITFDVSDEEALGVTVASADQVVVAGWSELNGRVIALARLTGDTTTASAQVNDGSVQRSRVTSLTVRFSSQVTFGGSPDQAFTLVRTGGGAVSFTATVSVQNGGTVVLLDHFTGPDTEFGSLADGRYTLTALASQISAGGQALDGDADGTAGGNFLFNDTQGLFRMFGDVNGDQTVNGLDLGFFRNAFGTQAGDSNYLSYLDLNGDGVINGFDLGQFRTRFGTMLP